MSFVEEMIEKKINKPESVKFCVMEGRQAKTPVRAHSDDAGIDIFAPLDMEEVTIQPNEDYLVKTGLKCICPKGYAMVVHNKSGVAVKKKLIHGACVVGDTYISTNKGFFKAEELSKDFITRNELLVKSYNEDTNTVEFDTFDGFRPSGVKETVRLFFDNNTVLECSEDHKILTSNGWKEAKDIFEDDEILEV